jgi:hypothetical protein
MGVAPIPESLDSVVVGHADAKQGTKACLELGCLQRVDVTNANGEAVPLEVPSAKLVRVTIGPEKIESLDVQIE